MRRCIATWIVLTLAVLGADARTLYTYTLREDGTKAAYDEALAVACLQGILNRDSISLYVLSDKNPNTQYWLNLLRQDGRWLSKFQPARLSNLDAVEKLAGRRLKGAVIWDPAVPATVNVATTIAGIEDGVVLSPEMAERYMPRWRLKVLRDLRDQFSGAETGSKKNDAYRWAIREYLEKGLCSAHLLCLFEDSFSTRENGDIGYVVTRDWAVRNKSFVFDLSPWGDERPADDPTQPIGSDLATYKMILAETQRCAAGKQMTEVNGFFAQGKYSQTPEHPSRHLGVPTEWESVWLMSPYNCYQNTITSDCYNQSLHSHAIRRSLKQAAVDRPRPLEKKAYICALMGDYDSSTPLYDYLPKFWQSPDRGKIPLAWAVDPNQVEPYPDLLEYFYSTATASDTFVSDASAAGYINPTRIARQSLPLFVAHNRRFFRETDMTMAPMVLDRAPPSPEVKDAYQQFAPDGYATIVADVNGARGAYPPPQIWKGMPIVELFNDTCNSKDASSIASAMGNAIRGRGNPSPGFYFFRVTWVDPTTVLTAFLELRRVYPDIHFEVVDPRTFFSLFKQSREKSK